MRSLRRGFWYFSEMILEPFAGFQEGPRINAGRYRLKPPGSRKLSGVVIDSNRA